MAISPVPFAEQNAGHPAALFRQAVSSTVPNSGGIVQAGDFNVTQTGTPSMAVVVGVGRAWVPGTNVANFTGNTYSSQAQYFALNDGNVTLTINTADPTNPRIDIVTLTVNDSQYSGATNSAVLQIITGTPAASPTAPTAPANSLVLAQVSVAANATSITNANITNQQTTSMGIAPQVYANSARAGSATNLLSGLTNHSIVPIIQAGTTVVNTDANGYGNFAFPKAFPNGLICWQGMNADNVATGTNVFITQGSAGSTQSTAYFNAYKSSGAVYASQAIRIDWIAIGW